MRSIFILLTSVCVLGFVAAHADAGGPSKKAGHPAPFGAKIIPAGYHHHGGPHHRPAVYHGPPARWYGYRPYRAPVYVPVPARPVYYYPRYYYYPQGGIYYSTPGFSIGVGF
ncbi:MAG: hypothetical protein JXB10_13785 [Pirellulales bacterium]|nr:hypothetical protein [Pirellulales bacterium]